MANMLLGHFVVYTLQKKHLHIKTLHYIIKKKLDVNAQKQFHNPFKIIKRTAQRTQVKLNQVDRRLASLLPIVVCGPG